jgi:hypothetical protein
MKLAKPWNCPPAHCAYEWIGGSCEREPIKKFDHTEPIYFLVRVMNLHLRPSDWTTRTNRIQVLKMQFNTQGKKLPDAQHT